ncbi:MAG: helix-turn-helix domain-containing protein [Candidatus Doudnabacteria bacterium]|nr:helix-turn-helix domain-containing protein [Candidatus Doudnabacteria bacterium]
MSEKLTKYKFSTMIIIMESGEVLKTVGLSQKEASVYLALMELGAASVDAVAKKAGTKRPTTYLVLDDLQRRGLVSLVPGRKKSLYQAESPETIVSDLYKKQELVKRFLPEFLALYNVKKEKPKVQLFEGKEGVRQVYQKIFEAGEVWFFGTVQELMKIYPEGLQAFVAATRDQKLHVRDFLTRSDEDLKYARTAQRGPNYDLRFLPEGFAFPSDSAIFANSVVFFSFHPQVFAVMISSGEIAGSLRALYELAWRSAEPYDRNSIK